MVDLTHVLEKLERAVEKGTGVALTAEEAAVLHQDISEMLMISGDFGEFDDSFIPKDMDFTLQQWLIQYTTGALG